MMWRYKLVCVLILATLTVNAKYIVSTNSMHWSMATCSLAEPDLTYVNDNYQVDEIIEAPKNRTDVWIGYQLAKMPFLFLGCGRWSTGKTYNITSIGDCYHLCGGGSFEIRPTSGDDILSNNTYKTCRCVTSPDFGNMNQNGSCDEIGFPSAMFSPIYVNSSEVSTSHNTSGDCLLYYYPKFLWGPCEHRDNIKVMCSTCKGSNTTAESFDDPTGAKNSWSAANGICLKHKYHPASTKSITNSEFGHTQKQYYWTGIIRSTAMIKSTSTGLPTTERSNPSYYTDDVCLHVLSTTEESISREFPVGVGIGVAVGIVCIVGAVVVIFVLRRRGVVSCKFGAKTAEHDAGNLGFKSRSYEETVATEPNKDNQETDNYNSIDDTEEPYQIVKDDYDYTTNALGTGTNTRKPANVYNKLKIDRPGDYDHVRGRGNDMPQPGSDYDTTALASRNDGGVDYNHISLTVSTTFARGSETKDLALGDYDAINGMKVKLPSSDTSEYAHVKI